MPARGAANPSAGYNFGGERSQILRRRLRAVNRDNLAERIAEHGNLTRAADEIGVSRSYGRLLWSEIKRGLGGQAR